MSLDQIFGDPELFRELAESIPQIVWISEGDGKVIYRNRRWFDYTGESPESTQPQAWHELVHPDDIPVIEREVARSYRADDGFEVECRLKRHDGEYRWFLGRAIVVKGADGKPIRRFGTATDIHDRRIANDRQRLLARTSEVLGSTLDIRERLELSTRLAYEHFGGWRAIYLKESEDRLRLSAVGNADPEKVRISFEIDEKFPYSPKDESGPAQVLRSGVPVLVPRIPRETLGAAAVPEHRKILHELGISSYIGIPLGTNRGRFGVLALVGTDRDRAFDDADFQLAEEFGRRIAWAIDNALLHGEQRDRQDELEQAVDARDLFLSVASHELRTPLTSMKLQVQGLKRVLERGDLAAVTPERLRILLEQSDRSIQRLTRLIEDMLDVSRIQSGRLELRRERFDLCALADEVLERFQGELDTAGIGVERRFERPVRAWGDRFRIDQALTNLITNAIRYAPGAPIRIGIASAEDRAVVRVEDGGPGIDPADHERIFDRFERLVGITQISGLGLGLFIVRQIVLAHGGDIRVESEPGLGSTFIFGLPLATDRPGLTSDHLAEEAVAQRDSE
jgi:PAS domain S-box-containing protein